MPCDYKKYPANWKTEIVPAVIERAGNCCEKCGLQNHTFVWAIKLWIKDSGKYKLRSLWFRDRSDAEREADGPIRKIKVVLTISHTDHDEENHAVQLDRLKALCQICHLRYDAQEKYRRVSAKWAKKKELQQLF
jgi:hypothetical protein